MLEFQKKQKINQRLYSKTTIVLLVVLIIFLAKATWNVYQKKENSEAKRLASETELKNYQEKELLLKSQVERLKTEKGAEEEIRRKFSVAKEGEKLVIVVDSKESKVEVVEKKSFFENIWSKLVDFVTWGKK